MDSFTDYYTVLGVKPNAPSSAIKAAFKKLALQYHPDVYKGEDAQERMRILLLAYQTLSDPASRRAYDARRLEHVLDASPHHIPPLNKGGLSGNRVGLPLAGTLGVERRGRPEVSPTARRDRQRHYDFPDVSGELPAQVDLGDITYSLSPDEARTLGQQGILRGVALEASRTMSPDGQVQDRPLQHYPHHCHRCHHRWTPASIGGGGHRTQSYERVCPACKADDWGEYLLLRCVHCHAVFESEQIRYEIGSYNYGNRSLCPPYELFPLCPYCGASGWCPAENVRVSTLRAQAERRATILRLAWISIIVVVVAVLGVLVVMMVK